MPKYTDEQIERAKNADVRSFLEQTEGYVFEGRGRFLKCRNIRNSEVPSSLSVDTHLNRIFYNSVTGNRPLSALDWCMKIKDMDFQTAMKFVIEEEPQGARAERPKYQQHRPQPETEISAPKNLELSEKSDMSKNVYAYLTKTRGIPQNIVNDCLNQNLIYQDVRKNAVFVGYDGDGKIPKYAARRGTFTPDGKEPFKRDCTGSDKNFAFRLEGKNTETVYVAEAAIDVLSLAALEDKFNGMGAYKNKTYLSTGGAGIDGALERFCKTHDVKTINVCFDRDEAGKNGMEKIMQKFRERGYTVNDMRASVAHDYNDELVAFNNNPNLYSKPPDVVKSVADKSEERSDNMPEKALENEKIEKALNEIFDNYSCSYERSEIEALPHDVQLHIAEMYNKRPFNENDINTYEINPRLDREIFKALNINDFKKIIGADELSKNGIEITDVKTKNSIGDYFFFEDKGMTAEDIQDSFNEGIREISFRNSDNENISFTNYLDLKKALDNPNDTFFHKNNEVVREKEEIRETITEADLAGVSSDYMLDDEPIPPDELAYISSDEQYEYVPFDDYAIPDEQNYYEPNYEIPYQERNSIMSEANIPHGEKMQGIFSVEQNGERMYRRTDMKANELLNICANSEQPYVDMSAVGEKISQKEYLQIQQSDKLKFSAELNLDNNSAKLYAVNMGKGGVAASERTPENVYTKTVKLSQYVKNKPEIKLPDNKTPTIKRQAEDINADMKLNTSATENIPLPNIPTAIDNITQENYSNVRQDEKMPTFDEFIRDYHSISSQYISKSTDDISVNNKVPEENHFNEAQLRNNFQSDLPDTSMRVPKQNQEKMQGLFSVEQNGETIYRKTDMTANELLNISANREMPYLALSKIGEKISASEYAEIEQSNKFKFSVEFNLDNKSAKLYAVNMGKGGIAEGDRTSENLYFKTVNLSDYVKKTPEKAVPDNSQKTVHTEMEQEMPKVKMNRYLLAAMDNQENKRAELIDKIGKIDSKIADRQERIGKLENKIADIETSMKTLAAIKRTFGAFGTLIDKNIEKKHNKIQKIRDKKIPKQQKKIAKQDKKKLKAETKLGKVNRKLDKIDKVQDFLSALGYKDKEMRHEGIIIGLENLSDIRRENLENKLHKTEAKIDMLSAKYSSPDISHSERYEVGKSIQALRDKASDLTDKIEEMNKLHGDLEDMKDGKFTVKEIEKVLDKTADKISKRIDNPDLNDEKGIINTVIAQSVKSGSEAISEVVSEKAKAMEQTEKIAPAAQRERIPEERQPDVTKNAEQKIINAVAAVTGLAVSELTRLPADIKADIISEYKENNGNITAKQLTERICDIADIEPPKEIKAQEQPVQTAENKEKEKSLNENRNRSADKVVREQLADDKPLFSRSKLMSDEFKPTSEKSQEDLNKKKDRNIGI